MADSRFTLRVLSTLGLRGVMTEITPVLTRRGLDFTASYGASNILMPRIAAGEAADVAILTDAAIEDLTRRGVVIDGSRRDLARSAIGIAVRAGAARPNIRTVDAFKETILAARSIAFSRSGASGLHFAKLIEQLGIAAEVMRKARVFDGVVGELPAKGDVEMAVQQVSELKLVDGIDILGALPDELQKITVFSAGVFARTARPAAAGLLIAALASPEAMGAMRRQGLEPVGRVG
ncbi:MAG TPA: substrate-binding domain-containing protein [Xanthobacteraceae bacterium]|nr:substrate-binding domain-containing protein [Xanthobacteraceae bacterium]